MTTAPTPLPTSLKQAVTLWLVAIGAGLFETILVVATVLMFVPTSNNYFRAQERYKYEETETFYQK